MKIKQCIFYYKSQFHLVTLDSEICLAELANPTFRLIHFPLYLLIVMCVCMYVGMYACMYVCVCVCVYIYIYMCVLSHFSHVRLFVTLWTVAR